MEKTLFIDGKEVKMRASALIPRLYRFKFGRDIIRDMQKLQNAYQKNQKLPANASQEERENAQFTILDLTIFENVAYIMAKQADPSIPDTIDEWMEGFSMFSIYEVMPEIIDLWELSNFTTSTPKKK